MIHPKTVPVFSERSFVVETAQHPSVPPGMRSKCSFGIYQPQESRRLPSGGTVILHAKG